MKSNKNCIILCEDLQQEVFIRRFLIKSGWEKNQIRIRKSSSGRGSGEQYVRKNFPNELHAITSKNYIQCALIVMVDGDTEGEQKRKDRFDKMYRTIVNEPRSKKKYKVAIFVPTWNIETWIAHLNGEEVDETSKYDKLSRQSACEPIVEKLFSICSGNQDDRSTHFNSFPPSLQSACKEYSSILK